MKNIRLAARGLIVLAALVTPLRFAYCGRPLVNSEKPKLCIIWLSGRSAHDKSTFLRISNKLGCYDGKIDGKAAHDLSEWLLYSRDQMLVIRSPGGAVSNALPVGRAIIQSKATVFVWQLCGSSCANYVFSLAHHRLGNQNSLVLFHGGMTPETINRAVREAKTQLIRKNIDQNKIGFSLQSLKADFQRQLIEQQSLLKAAGVDVTFFEHFEHFDVDTIDKSQCTGAGYVEALFFTNKQLHGFGINVDGPLPNSPSQASAILRELGSRDVSVCLAPDNFSRKGE